MCVNSFIEFASDAPIEFKTNYVATHRSYKISSQISSYSLKTGYLLGSAISGLQQALSKLYFNQSLDNALSTSIPIIMVLVGFVYGITFMIASTQKTNVTNLVEKYPHYFKMVPDIEEGVDEVIVNNKMNVDALKFRFI